MIEEVQVAGFQAGSVVETEDGNHCFLEGRGMVLKCGDTREGLFDEGVVPHGHEEEMRLLGENGGDGNCFCFKKKAPMKGTIMPWEQCSSTSSMLRRPLATEEAVECLAAVGGGEVDVMSGGG